MDIDEYELILEINSYEVDSLQVKWQFHHNQIKTIQILLVINHGGMYLNDLIFGNILKTHQQSRVLLIVMCNKTAFVTS
jgi:hypothetical protein